MSYTFVGAKNSYYHLKRKSVYVMATGTLIVKSIKMYIVMLEHITYICVAALVMNVTCMHGAAESSQDGLMKAGQEITVSKAREAYEQYADELSGKSHEELNALLSQVSTERTYNPSKIVALVYAGADPNNEKNEFDNPLLLLAIWKKNDALVRFLLANNADPNQLRSFLGTPVFWSCRSIPLLNEFVRFGADLKINDRDGENILHHTSTHSAYSYSTAFLMGAIQLGASAKQVSKAGYTPLMSLALQMDVFDVNSARMFRERAYLYLAAGAEPQQRVKNGGLVGYTAAGILRQKAQGRVSNMCKEVSIEVARMIDRYPLRSLKEYIIRCAILDARDADPQIAKSAQELIERVQEPETFLCISNKKIFDSCSDELRLRKKRSIRFLRPH